MKGFRNLIDCGFILVRKILWKNRVFIILFICGSVVCLHIEEEEEEEKGEEDDTGTVSDYVNACL